MSATNRRVVFIAAIALLPSCAVGPKFVRPEPPKEGRYLADTENRELTADGKSQRFIPSDKLAADWWRMFHCAPLDAIVEDAIFRSPKMDAAQAGLQESQASLRAGYGIFFPQIDADVSASRQQYSPQRLGQKLPSSVFNLFTLSASVSYAIDIWGGQRRAVEKLRAQMNQQRYAVIATYLMLSGNVVNTVIALAAYRDEIAATKELIALTEDQLRITAVQASSGTVPYVNVLSIKSQIASLRSILPPLEQKMDQAEHLLATLTGRTPAELHLPPIALADLTLPADLPVSLPSQMVRQRPDILVAEEQLHANNAAIGVATAAMLPSITLSGSYGVNNTSIANLFTPASLFGSIVGGLVAPLFQGGTLWYQRKAAIAARDMALANYRETVLEAFAQIADTLRGLDHDAQALTAQSESVAAAADALKLIQIAYQTGIANYLQVLIADEQYHQAKIAYIQTQAQRYQDTVALFVALGGGWWNASKPIDASH